MFFESSSGSEWAGRARTREHETCESGGLGWPKKKKKTASNVVDEKNECFSISFRRAALSSSQLLEIQIKRAGEVDDDRVVPKG